jgi:hypothetical protein
MYPTKYYGVIMGFLRSKLESSREQVTYKQLNKKRLNETSDTFIEQINIQSVYDNLVDYVEFKYFLMDIDNNILVSGIFVLSDNYGDWDASLDGAYQIVCDALELTIKEEQL